MDKEAPTPLPRPHLFLFSLIIAAACAAISPPGVHSCPQCSAPCLLNSPLPTPLLPNSYPQLRPLRLHSSLLPGETGYSGDTGRCHTTTQPIRLHVHQRLHRSLGNSHIRKASMTKQECITFHIGKICMTT